MGTGTPGSDAASANPQVADRYRVLARVGVGGTAVVYRCLDLHTEQVVAVKVLRTNGPLIPEAAARFRREAHLAATLSHPHIVRVLDFGYTLPLPSQPHATWEEDADRPVPYLAMEYVFGSTLKELVRRLGPLPYDWVWRIGEQLCAALAAAHAFGVVHRDVKPQNVMVLDAPMELLTKLTDFGIARQVGGEYTNLTTTGQVLGTPDYLSPEQVLGEPGGPSADLYALGVVLYELLTGRLPFEADSPLAAASRRMVADAPPLTAYRRDVPVPLQEVVLLALRRDPSERYGNALEFAQALRWSRERSALPPSSERGGWVLERKAPRPPKPKPDLVPIDDGAQPATPEFEAQSTVLRVTTSLAGFELTPDSDSDPLARSLDTSSADEPAGEDAFPAPEDEN